MDIDLEYLKELAEGTIDFVGQRRALKLTHVVTFGGVTVAGLAGIVTGNFYSVPWVLVAAYVATLILSLPFPSYRKNPVQWATPASQSAQSVQAGEKEVQLN